MGVYVKGMEMPKSCSGCPLCYDLMDCSASNISFFKVKEQVFDFSTERHPNCPLIPVPEHCKLKKRVVYRGDVFNALESARIIALDGILTDRYKNGFHDGLKRALEILANEVQDVPTIPAEEDEA